MSSQDSTRAWLDAAGRLPQGSSRLVISRGQQIRAADDPKATPAQRERPPVTAEELAEAMRAHRAEHGSMPSKRAMEMRLYGHYAGAAHEKVSAVWDEAMELVEEG